MYICSTHTYTYIHTYTHIYIYTCTYTYTYTYTHTYNHTHTDTHIYTYGKLFVNCSKIPHIQILHHKATSQLNPNKSQISGFHKMRNTGTGDPRTESSKKVNKSVLK